MPPNPLAQPFAPPLATAVSLEATAVGLKATPYTATNMLLSPARSQSALPSLPALSTFLLSHFPRLSPMAAAAEVPWLYHSPLPPRPRQKQTEPGVRPQPEPSRPLPAHSGVKRLVLSITPTEGVYTALGASPLPLPLNHPLSDGINEPAPATAIVPNSFKRPASGREKFTTAAFLHRPWALTRGRLPHGTTVWTSHKAFDESLTTGYNLALLERLGANLQDPKVLVGYKGDEGRRIGVVAGFGESGREELEMDDMKARIIAQFGDLQGEGGWFGFDDPDQKLVGDGEAMPENEIKTPSRITSIACMNAFHPAEIDRVADAAVGAGLATSVENCSGLLYLTGAVRDEGLEAASQKGMKVVCVGHRLCEVWGIAYLAEKVKEKWPEVEVQVVDEEEAKPPPREKKEVRPQGKEKTKNMPKPKQQEHDGVSENEAKPMVKRRRTDSEDNDEEGGVVL
jgi:putative NIF3 family GTP cyclohydrolase 1 type 2